MAKKKKKGGGGGSGMPAGYDQVTSGINTWNNNFNQWAGDAIDYGQNNQWAESAKPWNDSMLSGDMATNPWMSRLYGQTEGLDMDQGLGYLNDYLAGKPGGQSGGGSGSLRSKGLGGGGGGSTYRSSSSGGHVPDSTVGKGFFSEHINELFDPSRLDPANDPTMKPMIDNIQRESEESYWRAVTDLTNQAEGAGRYGGGLYQGMRSQHADEYHEALQGTMAAQYQHARDAALQRQMEALGLVNQRDMHEGSLAAQLEAAGMSAAASGNSARLGFDAQMDANRLQAIQMMLGAGQFGMQMGGNMAEVMQNGQLGAAQLGQGWANIGQHGYDQAGQFGELGLAGLGQLGSIYGNAEQQRLQRQRMQEDQRRWNEGAAGRDMNDLIRMMTGLDNLSGAGDMPGYMPGSSGAEPEGFNWDDILGGILGGVGTSFNMQNQGGN
jgi:hypothetical protein